MKVFSTLLTVAASLSPNDFLLGEGGIQRDPNEHVKTLQYFLENDLTGHGEIDHPVEIDQKEAVLTLVTETTTNEDSSDADVALANALLNDYIKPDEQEVLVEVTKQPELQVLPSDPLLKDLMLHASKSFDVNEVGSGEVPDSTTTRPITPASSTQSTSGTTDATSMASTTMIDTTTGVEDLINSTYISTSESSKAPSSTTTTSTRTTLTTTTSTTMTFSTTTAASKTTTSTTTTISTTTSAEQARLEESSTSTSSSTSASSASTSNTSTTSTSSTTVDEYQTTIETAALSEATTGKI